MIVQARVISHRHHDTDASPYPVVEFDKDKHPYTQVQHERLSADGGARRITDLA
jgi:hypothetical protein